MNNKIVEKVFDKVKFTKIASQFFIKKARECIKNNNKFTFVLSGGKTVKDVYIDLAKNHKYSIDWSKVHFFWLDERCVPTTHKESNYKLAYDSLINKLDNVGSINRMKGEINPIQSVKEYEKTLLNFFKKNEICFDFILLGMGEDGHVASLFSNTKELKEKKKIVLNTSKKHFGFYRITLSSNVINNSRYNLLLLKGLKKYDKFKEHNLPKDLVRFDKVIVFL